MMRTIRVFGMLCLVCVWPASAAEETAPAEDNETPVVTEVIDGHEVYGAQWPKRAGQPVPVDQAIAALGSGESKKQLLSGRVTKVCQAKGCWMILENNGAFARVDFNNHAFFIPKDSSGQALVHGVLSEQLVSEEKRAHLKADGAGELAEKTHEIVATSVMLLSGK